MKPLFVLKISYQKIDILRRLRSVMKNISIHMYTIYVIYIAQSGIRKNFSNVIFILLTFIIQMLLLENICCSLGNCLCCNLILKCNVNFNTTMFKLLFSVTQYNLLIQIYIKNGDSSKLLSLLVLMDYIIDSVINSPDIMKSY